MKILYLTLGIPDPPVVGPQIRDFELYSRIADRHEVQIIALTETSPQAPPREDRVGRVHPVVVPTALQPALLTRLPGHLSAGRPLATLPFVTETALARLNTLVHEWQPDIVQVEHSFLAPYVTAVGGDSGVRTVLSLHNVGSVQFERMHEIAHGFRERLAAWLKARTMRDWEAQWGARFDRVVTVSEEDRQRLLATDPRLSIDVVANGVDTLQPPLPPPQGHGLFFVGNLAYGPNVDAVHYFCEAVLPLVQQSLPDVTFTAVGFNPPQSLFELDRTKGVSIVDSARDLRPYYQDAAVCVVPLRAGGGTRIKILEAMALGRPVVSTTIGCEGLAVRHGEHLLVADDPAGFAQAIVDLCLDPGEADLISSRARHLCEQQYSWDTLCTELEEIYHDLLQT